MSTPGSEPNVNYTVKELIQRLEGKLDAYAQEQSDRVESTNVRVAKLEFQQKTLRVWGLVALFAGGAGGSMLAKALGLG